MSEQMLNVAGLECRVREARGQGTPVLYVHGVPNTGSEWEPFLQRTGGLAPDLPGFGGSAKPAHFDYSIDGYTDWLDALLGDRGIDRCRLVVHDWGGAALGLAQAQPERVERLVLINSVPLLPGYRWHTMARRWRTPLLGEMTMGLMLKPLARRALRETDGTDYPAGDFEEVWSHFDHGTQRAILKLYRSAPETVLEAAGARLGDITCPSLVVWGTEDPYLPTHFGQDYADALGGPAEVELVEGAGHWPWHREPGVIDRVAAFLEA